MACPLTLTYVITCADTAEFNDMVAHFDGRDMPTIEARTDDAEALTITFTSSATYDETTATVVRE